MSEIKLRDILNAIEIAKGSEDDNMIHESEPLNNEHDWETPNDSES